jgi:hypothetical protein
LSYRLRDDVLMGRAPTLRCTPAADEEVEPGGGEEEGGERDDTERDDVSAGRLVPFMLTVLPSTFTFRSSSLLLREALLPSLPRLLDRTVTEELGSGGPMRT